MLTMPARAQTFKARLGHRRNGNRDALGFATLAGFAALLGVVSIFSLASGAAEFDLGSVLRVLFMPNDASISAAERTIIVDVRFPRTILGVLVGAALAVSGAVMQGMFRNPLADPGIIGVSSGAGFAAATMIVIGPMFMGAVPLLIGIYALPLAAFFGAMVSTYLLYFIATRRGQTSVATMLLAGIALAALAGAFTGILVFMADDQQLRSLTFWGLGSLASATWPKIYSVAPIILPVILCAPLLARGLNALMLGEASAFYSGIRVQRLKNIAIITVATATGASVAVTGGIGFIGLVVPHVLRMLVGPDHRFVLPGSALLGAVMLLLADIIARQIVAPAELPIGIVTAIIGCPFFFWLILRNRSIVDL